MTFLSIQDTTARSGLTEPTLRYCEDVGLSGPIASDPTSGHRRYRDKDIDILQALACLRTMGVGIKDMPTYQANRALGHSGAGEQRDLLVCCAQRVEAEIETLEVHLGHVRAKAALWDARDHQGKGAESEANERVQAILPRWDAVVLP